MSRQPLRVLIVDDSRIFRGVIEEALATRDDVKVVGSVWSGEKALEFARQSCPDFVTLDINMPGLGGLETLKALRVIAAAQQQPIGVFLISSYTQRGAAVTIEGLQEGAFDFIAKPDGPDARANAVSLREQLFEKLNAFTSGRGSRVLSSPKSPTVVRGSSGNTASPRSGSRFHALVIGASTGGPEALARVLPLVAPDCPVPIFLVQHLPANLTEFFTASLARRCGSRVVEAREGLVAVPRDLYVASGAKHLVLHRRGADTVIGLSDAPPENGCRPAADVLFRSAAAAYFRRVLAVVLTGMGADGAAGAVVLKRAGAHVIAQDEASSVVWGMPGSVVAAGAADEVLPIDEIGPKLRTRLGI